MNDSDITILAYLMKAEPKRIPLGLLASETGLSIETIKERIALMRSASCDIEIDSAETARITRLPTTLQPIVLNAFLRQSATHIHLKFHSETASTNTDADAAIAAGEEAPLLVIAQQQTAGRGRMGREWFSQDQGNIYMSFGFAPNLPPSKMQRFTLWVGYGHL